MIKIGLCGLGHLGKAHLSCLKNTQFEIVGIHDIDHKKGRAIAEENQLRYFTDIDELIAESDAVDIVVNTSAHYSIASQCIKQKKAVFIEKPATQNGLEADRLISLLGDNPSIVQVGHIERYNPAYTQMAQYIDEPKFIETHRLAPMHLRGNDASVVMDLMIHDLDLILHWLPYEISDIRANGVSLFNESADICNVRIEFAQGSVCNITASRISDKRMRKSRIFQKGGYISIDFLEPACQYIRFSRKPDDEFQIISPTIMPCNALLEELEDFYACILNNTEPISNLISATKAIKLAEKIEGIVSKVDYIEV